MHLRVSEQIPDGISKSCEGSLGGQELGQAFIEETLDLRFTLMDF